MKQHNNNKSLTNNDSLTRTFIHLGDQPTNIDPNDIDIIAKYIYNCCGLDTASGTSFEALRLRQLLSTPQMSWNTCAFSSCDWTICKTGLYPSRVSLEAVSSGTRCTWSNIKGLEAVFRIDIFLNPFMTSLLFTWCPFFTENMFVH